MNDDIRIDLPALLATVTRPGSFATHGRVDAPPPALEVEGVGRVALPLLSAQIPALVAAAERAPYGKGMETLVDTDVRRTWQIGAGAVRLSGRHWPETLEGIVQRSAEGLGVAAPVAAQLYKLLVYDEGSFFLDHRDTEKAPGMFATLVVVLPSDYAGGELIVRHGGAESTFDLRPTDPAEITFAAFYADCVHEVRPITRGCRLVLIYNLVRGGQGALPKPPAYHAEVDALAERLWAWDEAPDRLVFPLEHAYTPAELAPAALKGRDAAVAKVVFEAARAADCEAVLALVTVEESGIAESDGGGYHRRRRGWRSDENDESFTVVETTGSVAYLEFGRDAEGRPLPMGRARLDLEELCPPDVFQNAEPEGLTFTEATGNEGASFERTYRRAALVVWQKVRAYAVVANDGPPISVPHLARIIAAGGAAQPLAGHIIDRWPAQAYHHEKTHATFGVHLLTLLRGAGETELIERYLRNVTARVGFAESEIPILVSVLGGLAPGRADALMAAVISTRMADRPVPTARLFARYAAATTGGAGATGKGPHRAAALALVAHLPGREVPPLENRWRGVQAASAELVTEVLAGLTTAGDAAAEQGGVDHLISQPARFPLDETLIPGVLAYLERKGAGKTPAMEALRHHCVEHLQARIAVPLEPPATYAREAKLSCRCASCAQAAAYLANPTQREWHLKALQDLRRHVEATLSGADVDCETLRNSSPHTLVCRKNQKSYLRRVAQRKEDLARLAALEG